MEPLASSLSQFIVYPFSDIPSTYIQWQAYMSLPLQMADGKYTIPSSFFSEQYILEIIPYLSLQTCFSLTVADTPSLSP